MVEAIQTNGWLFQNDMGVNVPPSMALKIVGRHDGERTRFYLGINYQFVCLHEDYPCVAVEVSIPRLRLNSGFPKAYQRHAGFSSSNRIGTPKRNG
jgi:hypothetical protein